MMPQQCGESECTQEQSKRRYSKAKAKSGKKGNGKYHHLPSSNTFLFLLKLMDKIRCKKKIREGILI